MNIEKIIKRQVSLNNLKLTFLLILTLTTENVLIRTGIVYLFTVIIVKSIRLILDIKLMKYEEVLIEKIQVDTDDGEFVIITNDYEYVMESVYIKDPNKCKLKITKYSKLPIEIIEVD